MGLFNIVFINKWIWFARNFFVLRSTVPYISTVVSYHYTTALVVYALVRQFRCADSPALHDMISLLVRVRTISQHKQRKADAGIPSSKQGLYTSHETATATVTAFIIHTHNIRLLRLLSWSFSVKERSSETTLLSSFDGVRSAELIQNQPSAQFFIRPPFREKPPKCDTLQREHFSEPLFPCLKNGHFLTLQAWQQYPRPRALKVNPLLGAMAKTRRTRHADKTRSATRPRKCDKKTMTPARTRTLNQ